VRRLGLRTVVHGVRYPPRAHAELLNAGVELAGWLSNLAAPIAFARAHLTVHVPRRSYAAFLPGIPTLRVFEALACGIPLVSAPWEDSERLFRTGEDYLLARSGPEMERHLAAVRGDPALRRHLSARGLETIVARHTCRHRVDELLAFARSLGVPVGVPAEEARATA